MLELVNVSKYYGKQKVLDNISLKLPSKGLFLIKGKSGVGKTTLFNLLSNLDTPTTGEIYYNGKAYTKMNDKDVANLRREIGFVFQDSTLINHLTIKDNLELVKLIAKTNIDISAILKQLDIENTINKYPNVLSGGEKQRVSIAISLIKDAKIILADEVTSNLDKETKEEVFNILKDIAKDRLVLIVSHDEYLIDNIDNNILLTDLFNKNTDLTSNDINNDISYNKAKNNPFSYLKYEFKLIKKSKILYSFNALILLIISFVSLIIFSLAFTTKGSVIYDINNYYNLDTIIVYDKLYSRNENSVNNSIDINYYTNLYPNTKINKVYYTCLDLHNVYVGIIIDDSLADFEVNVDEGFLDVYDATINNNIISILGIDFKVKDIKKRTNDDNYNFALAYNHAIYMNTTSFNKLNDIEVLHDYYGAYYINQKDRTDLDNFPITTGIYYDDSLKDNEIIIREEMATEGITLNSNIIYKGIEYKVVGFTSGDEVLFSHNRFNELINKYSYTPINMLRYFGLEFSINKEMLSIFNENYEYDTIISTQIGNIEDFYDITINNILSIIYPLVIVILVIFLMFVFYNFYKHFKKDMGYFLSLGASKLVLVSLYFTPILLAIIIMSLLSLILVLPILNPFNNVLLNLLNIEATINILHINILAIITTLGILLACYLIAVTIIYLLFKRQKTINIIYDR